jgi:hypothetical protein
MGAYRVQARYVDGTESDHVIVATTFDEAYHRITNCSLRCIGALVSSCREPELYTIYGLGF